MVFSLTAVFVDNCFIVRPELSRASLTRLDFNATELVDLDFFDCFGIRQEVKGQKRICPDKTAPFLFGISRAFHAYVFDNQRANFLRLNGCAVPFKSGILDKKIPPENQEG